MLFSLKYNYFMKKNTHPKKTNTTIILNDGSSINIKWIFFKKFLKLESDLTTHSLWKNKKRKH